MTNRNKNISEVCSPHSSGNGGSSKISGIALLPFLVFVAIYLGAGIIYQQKGVELAFYQFPSVAAMFIAVIVAFFMTKGTVNQRFSVFAKGIEKDDVITMLIIFILAGAFSGVAAAMGGRDATVNLGLSLVPAQYLAAGIFIISAFMGTATGTSMGTISAVVPIAAGVADKGGLGLPLVIGACVGGAMFGDNLSMISDTTIAATRSQGCEMKDKFRLNFLVALPAAVITVVILLFAGRPEEVVSMGDLSFNFIKVVPYLAVLVLAIIGINVFLVLTIGIFLAGFIGMAYGDLTVATFAQNVWGGFQSMNEVFFLTLFVAGMSELVMHNGGIAWLIDRFSRMMKGKNSAQVGISALVALTDCATANNTVAIVLTGGLANKVSHAYKVDPRKVASILDIFSCIIQGIIPYGAQLLTAVALLNSNVKGASFNPTDIIPYIWYCWILAGFGVLSIFIPYADGAIKKDPWNFEHDCPESKVQQKRNETLAENI